MQHLAVPILTASTCVAGVLAHKAIAQWRVISGVALASLALLGSILCVLNTLGRTASDRDHKQAVALASNRVLHERHAELTGARNEMARECRTIGPRCEKWQARVDVLQRETSSMLAVSVDPRADAIARLATLVGLDGERAKAIVQAIEPAALPIFLELGAIILLGVAFPHGCNRKEAVTVAVASTQNLQPTVTVSWTQQDALRDFKDMKHAGAQHLLATRWGIDRSTVSRWLKEWQDAGLIERKRVGKEKSCLALKPGVTRLLPSPCGRKTTSAN